MYMYASQITDMIYIKMEPVSFTVLHSLCGCEFFLSFDVIFFVRKDFFAYEAEKWKNEPG